MPHRTKLCLAAIATTLVACAPMPPPPEATIQPPQPDRQAQLEQIQAKLREISGQIVGQKYWTTENGFVRLCDEPDGQSSCAIYTGLVTIESLEKYIIPGNYMLLRVSNDEGHHGWAKFGRYDFQLSLVPYKMATLPDAYPSYLSSTDERRQLHGVVPGMTKRDVLKSAWGKPRQIIPEHDKHYERWNYPGNNWLTFRGDEVHGIGR